MTKGNEENGRSSSTFLNAQTIRGSAPLWLMMSLAVLLLLSFAVGCADEGVTNSSVAVADQTDTTPQERPVEKPPEIKPFSQARAKALRRRAAREISKLGGKVETSAMIFDVATNQVLFKHHSDRPEIPASNMKLFVGAAALDELGLDFRLKTRFAVDGTMNDGVLSGNLVVIGSGDPTIAARFFEGDKDRPMEVLAQALIDQGLKKIEGRILADSRAFVGPTTGVAWPKDSPWSRWMVDVSPLVFNDNQTTLRARTVKNVAETVAAPDVGYVKVKSRLSLTNNQKGHHVAVHRGTRDNDFVMRGRLWRKGRGYETDVNVHDGSLYFVFALRAALKKQGVVVEGGASKVAADLDVSKMEDLMVYTSPLSRTLASMLKHSQNLYAELILRILGVQVQGEGSFDAGTSVIKDWLSRGNVLDDSSSIMDGSGLSRQNRVSAAQVVKMLAHVAQDKKQAAQFCDLLAHPGKPGTLNRRLTSLRGRVFAKTGTMNGISALSGYILIGKDRLVAFSILCNHAQVGRARKAQDAICAAIAELGA